MKRSLQLGERGVRALVALCAHVTTNGNMARDGHLLAYVLLGAAGAAEDRERWRKDGTLYGRHSLLRLREAREDLESEGARLRAERALEKADAALAEPGGSS